MNHENSFTVSRYENRNGVISWRVAGWLHGVRIRKNFKTKEEAATEKTALELGVLRATDGHRSAKTILNDGQLREAEDAFRRVAGRPRSLATYLDYALANYREPEREKPLSSAVAEYLAVKGKEAERTLISGRQLNSIKIELASHMNHERTSPNVPRLSSNEVELKAQEGHQVFKWPGLARCPNRSWSGRGRLARPDLRP